MATQPEPLVKTSVPLETVLAIVREARPLLLSGRLDLLVEATGGENACVEVTDEFCRYAWSRGVYAQAVWFELWRAPRPKCYPTTDSSHCVAVVDRYLVDFTARQFDPLLPYPLVWDLVEERMVEA